MAIRVRKENIEFASSIGADVVITHIRFSKVGESQIETKILTQAINAQAGTPLSLPTFEVVYPANDLSNNHIAALVSPYWSGEDFEIDLLTDETTVVSVSGYSTQTVTIAATDITEVVD